MVVMLSENLTRDFLTTECTETISVSRNARFRLFRGEKRSIGSGICLSVDFRVRIAALLFYELKLYN